jgi:ATP-dependent RNA helicase DDX54/DBP10
MLDLQLFLGRPIITPASVSSSKSKPPQFDSEATYTDSLVLGTFERETIDGEVEYLTSHLDIANSNLPILRDVMRKGQSLYERSIGKASQASHARAKDMSKEGSWGLSGAGEAANVHPVLALSRSSAFTPTVPVSDSNSALVPSFSASKSSKSKCAGVDAARTSLIQIVESFRPNETVFEISARGKNNGKFAAGATLMNNRRRTLEKIIKHKRIASWDNIPSILSNVESDGLVHEDGADVDMEMANEEDLQVR